MHIDYNHFLAGALDVYVDGILFWNVKVASPDQGLVICQGQDGRESVVYGKVELFISDAGMRRLQHSREARIKERRAHGSGFVYEYVRGRLYVRQELRF